MTFERLKFLISKLPRIIKIAKELWLILSGTEQENIDQYLLEVENSVKAFRKAKDINERIEASRNISDLISRL